MGIVNVGSTLGGLAGGAATARLLIVISGQTRGLQTAIGQAQGTLTGFNKTANSIGNAMIRGVSLPLLAVGGASLKMAADFESAMGRVQGLTTITTKEFARASDEILDLARKYPTAPNELADALYFAASAGLTDFREAMEVVELSAGGAAIGMGEANDIAKVLIFSLNNFRSEGVDAARAMDVLTASIKAGTADPDQLALALGRVLGVARDAGVTFEETVASISALTNIGLPTRVASTSLRALFGGLLAPTQLAQERIAALGSSTQELRQVLATRGPLAAIEFIDHLADSADESVESVRRMVPQIRAFTAVLGLGRERAAESEKVFREVIDSVGDYQNALRIIQETKTYKFGQALNALRVAGIELGSALFPIFTQLTNAIAGFGEVVQNIPSPVKNAIAGLMTMGIIAGPLVKLWGNMTTVVETSAGAYTMIGGSIKTSAVALGAFGLALGLAHVGMGSMNRDGANLGNTLLTLASTAGVAAIALSTLQRMAVAGRLGVSSFAVGLAAMGAGPLAGVALGIGAVATGIAYMVSQSNEGARETAKLKDALSDLGGQGLITAKALRGLTGGDNEAAEGLLKAAKAADVLGLSLEQGIQPMRSEIPGLMEQMIKDSDAWQQNIGGARDKLSPFVSILQDVRGQAVDVSKAFEDAGLSSETLVGTLRNLTRQSAEHPGQADWNFDEVIEGFIGSSEAAKESYNSIQANNTAAINGFELEKRAQQGLAAQYGLTADEVTSALGKRQVTAFGLTDAQRELIAVEEEWINQEGKVVWATTKARRALEKLRIERQEALTEGAMGNFFKREVEQVEASTARLAENTDRQLEAMRNYSAALNTLGDKGITDEFLGELVNQGPAMVRKMATATVPELRRMEDNYFRTLAIIDEAILREGDHQKVKGSKIVSQFAQGISKNKRLPIDAARSINARVFEMFGRGRIDEGEISVIQRFIKNLSDTNIPSGELGPLIQGFITKLTSGDFKGAGTTVIDNLAKGMTKGKDLPEGAARGISKSIKDALGKTDTFRIGYNLALFLAEGVKVGFANHMPGSIRGMSEGTRAALQHELQGSPKLFTYYVGRDLVKQMGEGIARETAPHMSRPGLRRFGLPDGSSLGGRSVRGEGAGREMHFHFHGPVMGDKQQARKHARMVSKELRNEKVRQGNG